MHWTRARVEMKMRTTEEPEGSMARREDRPRHIQEVQAISVQLSATVAQTLALTQGQILTVIPPFWRDLRRVTVEIRGMMPNDAVHPHVLHLSDDRPPGLAALEVHAGPAMPEGPAIPPPGRVETLPKTPGAPPRKRRPSMTTVEADNVFADLELERMRVALDVDAGLDDDLPGEEADTEGPAEPSVALLCVLHFLRMAVYLPLILFRSIAAFELIRGTKAGPGAHIPNAHHTLLPEIMAGQPATGTTPPCHREDHKVGSRPGPNSRNHGLSHLSIRWLGMLLLLTMIQQASTTAVVDARVGLPAHRRNPGAVDRVPFGDNKAKPHGESHHLGSTLPCPRAAPKKRALRRAIQRASQRPTHMTWYRGRHLHVDELRQGHIWPEPKHDKGEQRQGRPQHRLRIITYNCGGLSATLYQEVLAWLRDEEARGHPVDIICLQETSWCEDFEYVTATTNESDAQWYAIHAGGPTKTGILVLLRRALLPAANVRYVVLLPGRLVHIRLLFQLPLDILCTYQTSWNPTNSSLTATNKVDALVRQRAKLWAEMEKWLSHIPLRNGTLVVGDMNTPLLPEPPICGPGVASERGPAQRDQEDFQALLRRTGCQALNTWRSPGIGSRTFLPPTAGPNQHGTQIDFILARGGLADHEARQARTITAPFVPSTGCRHLPLQTTLPLPRRPRPPANRPGTSHTCSGSGSPSGQNHPWQPLARG